MSVRTKNVTVTLDVTGFWWHLTLSFDLESGFSISTRHPLCERQCLATQQILRGRTPALYRLEHVRTLYQILVKSSNPRLSYSDAKITNLGSCPILEPTVSGLQLLRCLPGPTTHPETNHISARPDYPRLSYSRWLPTRQCFSQVCELSYTKFAQDIQHNAPMRGWVIDDSINFHILVFRVEQLCTT